MDDSARCRDGCRFVSAEEVLSAGHARRVPSRRVPADLFVEPVADPARYGFSIRDLSSVLYLDCRVSNALAVARDDSSIPLLCEYAATLCAPQV